MLLFCQDVVVVVAVVVVVVVAVVCDGFFNQTLVSNGAFERIIRRILNENREFVYL